MLSLSPGVEYTWRHAVREAVATQHEHIEPYHLLMGVCMLVRVYRAGSFAEPTGRPALDVGDEARHLHEILSIFDIDPDVLYRQARAAVGKGTFERPRTTVHRSEESRAIFRQAERRAEQAQASTLDLRYLIATLVGEWGQSSTLFAESNIEPAAFVTAILDQAEPSFSEASRTVTTDPAGTVHVHSRTPRERAEPPPSRASRTATTDPVDADRVRTLAPRERQVAARVAAGMKNWEIAEDLVIGVETVKTNVATILKKLNCETRTGIASKWTAWSHVLEDV